ncbi:hypothetical protein ACFV0R_25990 [Streptomyces sp. NPDC059578]|uniref:hypothetical protein n=1 Tax=unclassified Streptomyces TaxID=2593676 RepID=UPI003653B4E8
MITTSKEGAFRPTAGALRLVEAGAVSPGSVNATDYISTLAEYCPYLKPSRARGMTGWTVYEIAAGARASAVEAELFYAGVQAAERVRLLMARAGGVLACESIVLLGQAADADHRELMTWPHWALKNLYGPVGLMFGKFTEGTQDSDRFGRTIPPAPFSFLPVRASVRLRDPKFLEGTPGLAAAVAAAADDGRDVFGDKPHEWKAVRAWASSLPVPRRQ